MTKVKVSQSLSAQQALKTLARSKRLTTYVEKKFSDQKKSLKQWEKIFNDEKIM